MLIDDYFWLREKANPEVIAHLEAENAYTEAKLSPHAKLRTKLFEEMKARIVEDDLSVPYKDGEYFYYSRMQAGRQHALYCRKRLTLDAPEEVMIDGNILAEGQSYFALSAFSVSPDGKWLAYAVDFEGSEKYCIFFKELATGRLSPESISDAGHSLAWASDNRTLFYTLLDESLRPDRLYRHVVGRDPAFDTLLHQEEDGQYFVYCSKSRSDRFIFLEISGKITSETWYIDAANPEDAFQIVEPRRHGVEYSVDHHDERFLILTNDVVKNFRLVEAPVKAPGAANWREVRRGSETIFLEDLDVFRSHLVLQVREKGLEKLLVLDLPGYDEHEVEFAEPAYSLSPQANAEFDTSIFRFTYSSMVTPNTVIDYDVRARTQEIKKCQQIPSGYDRSLYRTERIFAKAPDGVEVPISLSYRLDSKGEFRQDGSRPLYLYGYGSYGFSKDASFATTRLSLMDRGFVYAMAHIRGGSDLGRQWYEDGKFLKKKNTFTDFIACAERLAEAGYAKRGEIAIAGGSAGGMLVGAVVNLRPDLFKAAVAHVPFVDVLNTMLDDSLPLTPLEYDEWGNPADPTYYRYIKSYSPYENVRAQRYPHLLVTSGLHDPRVTYWEPAKWVAKLREMKTDDHHLLQHINMEAGHGGPSGRYEALKEYALEFTFLLKVFDMIEEARE